ncbi:flagellar biosynthesis anti-sigma factor FlgM [Alicyclobacillus sp.]|uniref:flagellar biosynthesis anti-sigma factor FlgM n=1 Tax=Alicyclobacillus sp. TaxID=61169 RepID=UPI0025C443C1|nr:flagellar biosynthesis anti-sigma factor FlgM [Alicyclobacillus sp.]MCL6516742.1 flagellar biosynthesis anti-sigma factor FlgM [Alicyclobacillus sp.]
MRIDDLNRYMANIERVGGARPRTAQSDVNATSLPGPSAGLAGRSTGLPGPSASLAGRSTGLPGPSAGDPAVQAAEGGDRAERIARLKEAFRNGQTPDLQRLADTLLQSGIFFDERA